MDEDERQTDCQTCEVVCCAVCLACCTEHYEHEQCCQHELYDESVEHAAVTCVSTCLCAYCEFGSCLYDCEETCCGENGADYLEEHVHCAFLSALHTAAQVYSKGDGGVDVATADATDCVSHSYY